MTSSTCMVQMESGWTIKGNYHLPFWGHLYNISLILRHTFPPHFNTSDDSLESMLCLSLFGSGFFLSCIIYKMMQHLQ